MNLPATEFFDVRRDIRGNPQAGKMSDIEDEGERGSIPSVLRPNIRKRAKTCAAVLYSPLSPDPHTGLVVSSARLANSARRNSVDMLDHEGSGNC